MSKVPMPKRVYEASERLRPKWGKVYAWVMVYLPRALKRGNDDLLAETLEQACSGTDKDGQLITDYWGYCTRTLEQKTFDRNAADGDAAARQEKLALGGTVKNIMQGLQLQQELGEQGIKGEDVEEFLRWKRSQQS